MKTMIGFGLVVGALPALLLGGGTTVEGKPFFAALIPALVGVAMVIQGTLYAILTKAVRGKTDPLTQRVLPGRKAGTRKRGFCGFPDWSSTEQSCGWIFQMDGRCH